MRNVTYAIVAWAVAGSIYVVTHGLDTQFDKYAAMIPGLLAVVLFLLTIAIYVLIWPDAGPKGGAAGSGLPRRVG